MTTPNKDNNSSDILTELEGQKPKGPSKLQSAFGFAAAVRDVVVWTAQKSIEAARYAYGVSQIPAVQAVTLTPFSNPQTPTQKAVAYGALGLGLCAGYAAWGWAPFFGTGIVAKVTGWAIAVKGTQMACYLPVALAKKSKTGSDLDIDQAIDKSQAEEKMGEAQQAKTPKPTAKTQDLNKF